MKILYKIQSDRTQDVKLDDGATVRKLRDFCAAKGYDVMNAKVFVVRENKPPLYGDLLDYVIGEGDVVYFDTFSVDLPNLRSSINAACEKAQENVAPACDELKVDVQRNHDGSVTINIR